MTHFHLVSLYLRIYYCGILKSSTSLPVGTNVGESDLLGGKEKLLKSMGRLIT